MSVGVDLGGTHVRGVLLGPEGEVLEERRLRVGDDRRVEAVLDRIAELASQLADEPDGRLTVGVGVAGWLDRRTGRVSNAPNLGWRDVDVHAPLLERLGEDADLVVVNDLTAVTFGEWRAGAGRGADDMLCVFVGSGLGAGMVLGGRLYEGSRGIAGELGHVQVVEGPGGERCGCGRTGCVEAYVGGRYLEARAAAGDPDGPPRKCEDIEAAYTAGEGWAVALWEEAADRLAQALTTAIQILDPEVVVLGGGAIDAAPSYRALALDALRRRCPTEMLTSVEVRPSTLGGLAGAIGAALLARDRAGGSGLYGGERS